MTEFQCYDPTFNPCIVSRDLSSILIHGVRQSLKYFDYLQNEILNKYTLYLEILLILRIFRPAMCLRTFNRECSGKMKACRSLCLCRALTTCFSLLFFYQTCQLFNYQLFKFIFGLCSLYSVHFKLLRFIIFSSQCFSRKYMAF